jgi:hypothetical protein
MGLDNFFDKDKESPGDNDDILSKLSTPLQEIEEPDDYGFDDGDEGKGGDDPEKSNGGETNQDETEKGELKKRFQRLNKQGAKGIVKILDLGNANLCRKLSYSDDAEQFRADKDDLEDLQEVLQEILPNKGGDKLSIPVWVQLIIYILLAFAPAIITALTERGDNKELKRVQKELDMLKKEREIQKIREEMAKDTPDEKLIDEMMVNAANGKGVKTDDDLKNEDLEDDE